MPRLYDVVPVDGPDPTKSIYYSSDSRYIPFVQIVDNYQPDRVVFRSSSNGIDWSEQIVPRRGHEVQDMPAFKVLTKLEALIRCGIVIEV